MDQIAGLRTHSSKQKDNDNQFGEWEKNTKGIGSKLLLKMGFQPGKGLGKNLQGISNPIEAKPHQGKWSLSYNDKNVSDDDLSNDNFKEIKFEKKSSDKIVKKNKNDRYFSEKVEKIKKNYIYTEENNLNLISNFTFDTIKVVDMTGPEQKVFSGYDKIHKTFKNKNYEQDDEESGLDENNEELDNDKERLIKDLEYERDRINDLKEEKEKCNKEITYYNNKKTSLEYIIDRLKIISKNSADSTKKTLEIFLICKELKDNIIICDVFRSFGFYFLETSLKNWNCFESPDLFLDNFEEYKEFFGKFSIQFYELLVWECWIPAISKNIQLNLNIKKCDKIIIFLEKWKNTVPKWTIDYLISKLFIPSIELNVSLWDPTVDQIPIHLWIHPWLPWFKGHYIENIYTPIRQKLASALNYWNPSDRSAKIILDPWKYVFDVNIWKKFLKDNIVKKLDKEMSEFLINPKNQDLTPWYNLMDWKDVLPQSEIIEILKKNFFPKWLKVLFNWLNNKPIYKEISNWYLGWKKLFPEQWFKEEIVICQGFTVALTLIDQALNDKNL